MAGHHFNPTAWKHSNNLQDGGANYANWKGLVEMALINAGVEQYIEPGKPAAELAKGKPEKEAIGHGNGKRGNAKAYMIIHGTCGREAERTIASTKDAEVAWAQLGDRYETKGGFDLAGRCFDRFLGLQYRKFGDIAAFNAEFRDAKRRIEDCDETLPPALYVHLYLKWVDAAFPMWAKRLRQYGRSGKPTNETLDNFMRLTHAVSG